MYVCEGTTEKVERENESSMRSGSARTRVYSIEEALGGPTDSYGQDDDDNNDDDFTNNSDINNTTDTTNNTSNDTTDNNNTTDTNNNTNTDNTVNQHYQQKTPPTATPTVPPRRAG